MSRHAAIDLGAASGRVVGDASGERITLKEFQRITNGPVDLPDGLHRDVFELYRSALLDVKRAGLADTVGEELEQPVLTAACREANFTNELGVDGRIRYLRNVMGLWIRPESLRAWNLRDDTLQALLAEAAHVPK